MIRNFSDHSANERTFLAWVRTAIAVMAFGFLVAKFDLFLKIAARSLAGGRQAVAVPGSGFGGAAGVVLILAGTLMVGLAGVRFVRTGRAIDSANPSADSARVDLALAGMMVALGISLVLYLAHTLLTGV
jgi:putative membrane protein